MTTAMVQRGFMALEKPAFIKDGDTRGTENIGRDDIKPPAIKLAQAMSDEVKRSESVYIEGLREGEFFNSVTKQVLGEAIQVVIINQLGHRNVEFDPNDRKVVLDGNVPDDDPRTQFTEQVVDGVKKRLKPRATKFYDYLVLLMGERGNTLSTMSLKSTQIKKALELNTLLKGLKTPSFALIFDVKTVPEKRPKGTFYGWKITPAGWATEALYKEAAEYYDKMAGKKVEVETEAEPETKDDDIPF